MNTKGIKFLSVLAVLAMAFAAFAVITTAESNDAASTTVVGEATGYVLEEGVTAKLYTWEGETIVPAVDYYSTTKEFALSGEIRKTYHNVSPT